MQLIVILLRWQRIDILDFNLVGFIYRVIDGEFFSAGKENNIWMVLDVAGGSMIFHV